LCTYGHGTYDGAAMYPGGTDTGTYPDGTDVAYADMFGIYFAGIFGIPVYSFFLRFSFCTAQCTA